MRKLVALSGLLICVCTAGIAAIASGDDASPQFTFGTDQSNATFQCSVDGGAFADCSSPQSYSNLMPGAHTVDMRASFTVPTPPPPPPPAGPTAAFSVAPASPVTGSPTHFDGTGSVCNATPCSYQYTDITSSGTGNFPLSSSQSFDFTFKGAGTKYVQLTVTDANGATDKVEHDVVVGSPGPPPPPPPPPPNDGTNCAVLGSNGQPDAATLDSCGYPSPNTTGAKGTLTPIAQASLPVGARWSGGTLTIGANTTVTGVDIEGGQVSITGNNAQLNNSKVVCGSGSDCITNNGHTGSSLSDDTVQGTGNTGNALCIRAIHMEQDVSMVVKRAYITNCTDGVVGLSNTSDSYININGTYQGSSGPTHNEPIYLPGGNTTSADIEHNTLLLNQTQVAAVFGDDHAYGPLHKVTINNNLLASAGSNGFVATGKSGDGNTAIVITNNRFSYIYGANESTGGNAPPPATSWSGNYRDDTLATVAFK